MEWMDGWMDGWMEFNSADNIIRQGWMDGWMDSGCLVVNSEDPDHNCTRPLIACWLSA